MLVAGLLGQMNFSDPLSDYLNFIFTKMYDDHSVSVNTAVQNMFILVIDCKVLLIYQMNW